MTARGSGEGAQVTMPCSRSRNARHSVRKSGIIITGGKLARECRAKSAPCDARFRSSELARAILVDKG